MQNFENVEQPVKEKSASPVEFDRSFDAQKSIEPSSKTSYPLPEMSLVSEEVGGGGKDQPARNFSSTQSASDIVSATNDFEKWEGDRIKLVPEDLAKKHADMAADPFSFMRATYYRWAEEFPQLLPDLAQAPKVNSIGDLHVENFGTWKDAQGRSIWGVNDFDEACKLPYTNDLVRLTTSANLLIQSGQLKIGANDAAAEILDGYTQALKDDGKPFVISDPGSQIGELANDQAPKSDKFWRKLDDKISKNPATNIPPEALAALQSIIPGTDIQTFKIGHRQAGEGSLGRERFAATTMINGKELGAEVKSVLPSANSFVTGENDPSFSNEIMKQAIRAQDPLVEIGSRWEARSLSPSRFSIELTSLSDSNQEKSLLWAMGYEAANIHLGSTNAAPEILADLSSRKTNWLADAANTMTENIIADQSEWKNHETH